MDCVDLKCSHKCKAPESGFISQTRRLKADCTLASVLLLHQHQREAYDGAQVLGDRGPGTVDDRQRTVGRVRPMHVQQEPTRLRDLGQEIVGLPFVRGNTTL